jgi:hypothetical protein
VVSLTASNSNGASINQSTETIIVNSTNGLNESNNASIAIYPNPVNDILNVKLNQLKINAIKITSIIGTQIDANFNKSNNSIDVSHLNAGTYFLAVTTDNDEIIISKFIKK